MHDASHANSIWWKKTMLAVYFNKLNLLNCGVIFNKVKVFIIYSGAGQINAYARTLQQVAVQYILAADIPSSHGKEIYITSFFENHP